MGTFFWFRISIAAAAAAAAAAATTTTTNIIIIQLHAALHLFSVLIPRPDDMGASLRLRDAPSPPLPPDPASPPPP